MEPKEDIHQTLDATHNDVLVAGISKSALRWVLAGLSLILFIAIVGFSYSIGVDDAEKGAIPIIRSDGTAIKVRPENPGGKKYDHQDLTIYNSFRNDIPKQDVQLVDDTEKPAQFSPAEQAALDNQNKIITSSNNLDDISNDNTSMKLVTVSKEETPKEITQQNPDPKNQDPEEKIRQIVASATPEKKQITPEIVKKVEKERVQPAKTELKRAETIQKVTSQPKSGAFLQIGAYRSEADAQKAASRAKSKYSELSSKGHIIVRADLGAKGTYYRLRVGPFASKQDSLNVCNHLKSKGQACIYTAQ